MIHNKRELVWKNCWLIDGVVDEFDLLMLCVLKGSDESAQQSGASSVTFVHPSLWISQTPIGPKRVFMMFLG